MIEPLSLLVGMGFSVLGFALGRLAVAGTEVRLTREDHNPTRPDHCKTCRECMWISRLIETSVDADNRLRADLAPFPNDGALLARMSAARGNRETT